MWHGIRILITLEALQCTSRWQTKRDPKDPPRLQKRMVQRLSASNLTFLRNYRPHVVVGPSYCYPDWGDF